MDPVGHLELSNFAIMPSNCVFIMSLFYANVPVSGTDSHSRQFLMRENSFETASTSVDCIGGIRIGSYDIRSRKLQGMFAHAFS